MIKRFRLFLRLEFYVLLFCFILACYPLTLNFKQSDKEIFIFFAMHYKNSWYSLQDNHIGGVTYLNTYPPLIFQILALFSYMISFNISYILLMLIFWFLLSFYSTKFFFAYMNINKKKTYFWLIFLFNFFSIGMLRASLLEGWLTTVAGLAFIFMSLYYFILFLKYENKSKALFILPFILTGFTHQFSFIFLFITYSLVFVFEYKLVLKKIKPIFLISFFLLEIIYFSLVFNTLLTILKDQQEVYHPSRDPLLPRHFQEWFYAHFGVSLLMLLMLPFYKPLRKAWKLYLLAFSFLVIGLARTTPLSKILFGGVEKWVAFDKFLFFSSIFLNLFLGFFIISLIFKYFKPLTGKVLIFLILVFYLIYNLSEVLTINPLPLYKNLEIEKSKNYILSFLNSQSPQYRYQTFGYTGKLGDFYLNTKMPTTDTDFISFQNIDFIKENGIRHINDIRNGKLIQDFFNITAEYSVKYVITFNDFYSRTIGEQKWKILQSKTFDGFNVTVWENPLRLKPVESIKEKITIFNYLWGIVPLILFVVFIMVFIYHKFIKKDID